MSKIHFIQFSAIVAMASIVGCATTSPGTSPLAAADRSLSAVETAAQSGKQIIGTGAQVASDAGGTATIGLVDINGRGRRGEGWRRRGRGVGLHSGARALRDRNGHALRIGGRAIDERQNRRPHEA